LIKNQDQFTPTDTTVDSSYYIYAKFSFFIQMEVMKMSPMKVTILIIENKFRQKIKLFGFYSKPKMVPFNALA
jgi:hypothetical protein